MKFKRRQFVQSSLLAGAGLLLNPFKAFNRNKSYTHFGLNPFIIQNPEAVFIMRTNVDSKTSSLAIKKAGLDFGHSVFKHTDNANEGIPLSYKIAIKPNLTCRMSYKSQYTIQCRLLKL
jgi:hypothetical protein